MYSFRTSETERVLEGNAPDQADVFAQQRFPESLNLQP